MAANAGDSTFGTDESSTGPGDALAAGLSSLGAACSGACSALAARPSIAAAIAAAVLGLLLGNWLAGRFPRRELRSALPELPSASYARRAAERGARWASRGGRRAYGRAERLSKRAARYAPDASDVGEQVQAGISLVPLVLKLLSNPIVRFYVRRSLTRQLARSIGR